jgi:outer membrane protein OmpA-like peptidoglycan-associated protein
MFWGGLRFRFGGEGAAAPVAPPPPGPPEAPAPPPPAPPAPAPAAEPEFVWPEVYFPFDQYVLTPESREKIDSVAKYMTDNPNMNVTIEGHCCYIGTDEYNLALGQQRADAIRDYLTGKGISASRLKTVSYGEARPKYDNEKEITRRFNRRGFFVVIKPQ